MRHTLLTATSARLNMEKYFSRFIKHAHSLLIPCHKRTTYGSQEHDMCAVHLLCECECQRLIVCVRVVRTVYIFLAYVSELISVRWFRRNAHISCDIDHKLHAVSQSELSTSLAGELN